MCFKFCLRFMSDSWKSARDVCKEAMIKKIFKVVVRIGDSLPLRIKWRNWTRGIFLQTTQDISLIIQEKTKYLAGENNLRKMCFKKFKEYLKDGDERKVILIDSQVNVPEFRSLKGSNKLYYVCLIARKRSKIDL